MHQPAEQHGHGGMSPLGHWRCMHHADPPARPPTCLPTGADPEGLAKLKFLATRWHIAFSAMLVLGLLLSTLM